MAITNFEFFKNRCQQRWNRRDTTKDSFFFICYIFYKDGTFATVRNNQATLNGIVESDVHYFEGMWEDRYNHRYNDDGNLSAANHSSPRHTRVHHNDDGVKYSAVCECDACKSGSFDNGFFFINTATIRKCQHDENDACPCDDIMCPDCSCVTLDAGLQFIRIIGVQGLSTWYENRYQVFNDEQKELNLTTEEYEARAEEEIKIISNECNAFIVKLEEAIKRDYEQFYAITESSCSVCGQPFGDTHLTGTNSCKSRGGWSGSVNIMHTERPLEDVKQNMSTYTYEGRVKDRYESFIYEWRQVIVKFRLKYGINYEYDV